MKKLMLLTAALIFAATSYAGPADNFLDGADRTGQELRTAPKQINVEPFEAVNGTIFSALGNTIQYSASVARILKDDVAKATVSALVDSGECAVSAQYPNNLVVCGVELGGNLLTITASAAGKAGQATIFYVTNAASDVLDYWANAFYACADVAGPVLGAPCKAVAFVLDASGKLIKATGIALANYVGNGTNDVVYTIDNIVDIPTSLLEGDLSGTGKAVVKSVHALVCTFADFTIVGLVGIVKNLLGEDHTTACEEAAELGQKIDAGDWSAPQSDDEWMKPGPKHDR